MSAPGNTGKSRLLPYFHARVVGSIWSPDHKIYRIYVAVTDLLVINLGVNTLTPEQAARQQTGAMGGGLIPALVGGYTAAKTKAKIERWAKALADADETVLRQFIAEDDTSFILSKNDMDHMRVEPHSFWTKMKAGADTVARVTFTHAARGDMTLAPLTLEDVTAAANELPKLMGHKVTVKISWESF